MEKILIVSDTHRKDLNLKYVIDKLAPIDMLIHLGDIEGSEDKIREWANCPTAIVLGNNDFFSVLDREKEILLGSKRALITHGHLYGVSLGVEQLRKEAISRGFDIVMFGHTHKPYLEIGDKVTMINPGSISYPRQNERKPSYMIVEIDNAGQPHYTMNYLESHEIQG